MNNLLQQLTKFTSSKGDPRVVLLDRTASASELAFMLRGEWDNCNSVTLTKYDRVAISSAAALLGAKWCRCGDSVAWLPRLAEQVLLDRYKTGERYFINANLRCSRLKQQCLQGVSLNRAFLNQADLTEIDLSNADLTAADATSANLTRANLTNANLFKINLTDANLSGANFSGAKLQKACLKGANLDGANFDGADLSLADLRETDLSNVSLLGTNLTNAMLTVEQLPN